MSKTETMDLWGAVGPNGRVVKSSIGAFRSNAVRYAQKHKGFRPQKLGEMTLHVEEIEGEQLVDEVKVAAPKRTAAEVAAALGNERRGPGRPRTRNLDNVEQLPPQRRRVAEHVR